jgi:hypothetical protein
VSRESRCRGALLVAVVLTACTAHEPGREPEDGAAPHAHSAAAAPGVRNAHALASDPGRAGVLLLAGADASAVRSDLWLRSGGRWDALNPPGDVPPPRTFPAVATDSKRGRVVLFGGNRVLFGSEHDTGTFLADTWEWDGASWTHLEVSGPSPRAEAAMAYDEGRGRVVLFGGYSLGGTGMVRHGDTWEWDGARWSRPSETGPSPRTGAAMAYDARLGRIVLFGGGTGVAPSGETWEWDGGSWKLRAAVAPGRYNAAMAYDAARGRLVRFGGWDGERRTADTWLNDGERWIQVVVASPFPRNHAAMAYDPARERAVLFGGHDGDNVFGDLWEWDGVRWVASYQVPIEPRLDNGH